MKTVVYITKNKIWAGESSFDWDGVSLDGVFERIKKELKVDEMRVVLGNDVSFVTAVKAGDTFLSRENILKLVKSWMPFEIDDDCFDWKEINLAPGDVWIQIVALEKELLMSLSSAVKMHGIKVELVTAIGVLLADQSSGREAPAILKWTGKENLSVLAINGLADLVVTDINEEDLMVYASQKWGLAVNPEVLVLNENEFDFSKNVFSQKTKGEDRLILNLPILKEVVTKTVPGAGTVSGGSVAENTGIEEVFEKKSKLWIYLLILVVVVAIGGVVLVWAGTFKSIFPEMEKAEETVTPSISPTIEVTPEPTIIDLESYQVQVLNGSGVAGEAAKIKNMLLDMGFVSVDTGNAEATTEARILAKETVSESVKTMVFDSIKDYKIGSEITLTLGDKYDLIIVVGSTVKI